MAIFLKDITLRKKDFSLSNIKPNTINDIILKSMYITFGLLSSRGTILGRYFPFGLSLIAASPESQTIYSLIGAIIGYIFQVNTSSSVRYISTAIAIAAIKWTLSELKYIKNHRLYIPLLTFIPTFFTGMALNSIVDGFDYSDVTISLIEATFASVSAYFFNKSFKAFYQKKSILNPKELVCILVSFSIILLSLSSVSIGTLSIGRIISVTVILLFSLCANISGGCIAGVSSGIILSFSSFGLLYTSSIYAFSGMMSGFFSYLGKIGVCVAFLLSHILISFQSGDISYLITGTYEILIGIIIFLSIPKSFINYIKEISFYSENKVQSNGLKNSVIQRLKLASESLLSVSNFVDKVSVKLSKIESPEIKDICKGAVYSTCNNCNLKTFCWEKEKSETSSSFSNITRLISYGKEINKNSFPEKLSKRCSKIEEIIAIIKENYKNYISKLEANNRMKEFRNIVSGQFDSMGYLLDDIAEEFQKVELFDQEKAFKIKERLKLFGINICNVTCKRNRQQRITIEIDTPAEYKNKFILNDTLLKELSSVCEKSLDEPSISNINNSCRIQISEKTIFQAKVSVNQHACNNGKLCGDNYLYFNDGSGNLIVIISDGMGTGGKAAVDGAMASELMSKLIKSGINFDSAIKIVNSALLVKSGDESLATLDVLSLNLFTGKAELMKAGAPATFIRKNHSIEKIDLSSLPIGILNEAMFLHDSIDLDNNDMILMLSDGVTDTGDKWVEEELREYDGKDIERFTKGIVNKTISKRKKTHDDDITAITIKLYKNTK